MSKHCLAPDQGLQLPPGCRMLSGGFSFLWAHPISGSAARFVHQESKAAIVGMRSRCWWGILLTAAVFFFFHAWASSSISLPPALVLSAACIALFFFFPFFLTLWHILYLKLFLNRSGDSLLLWHFFFLPLQAEEVFLRLHCPAVGHRDSPTLWCQRREGENQKEWCIVVTEALSFCVPMWDLVSCLTLKFATLTESLFQGWKAGGSSAGCSLCVCCFWWTLVLHHTLHGSERGMESSSNFIIQHSLRSHTLFPTHPGSKRESTL